MPQGRLVSASFFDKLAQIQLPPDTLVPRFVCACIKSNGTCGVEDCRSNIGQRVRDHDIRLITTTKLGCVRTAEAMMQSTRDALRAAHIGPHDICMIAGDMDIKLVDVVFGKAEPGTTFESVVETCLKTHILRPTPESASVGAPSSPKALNMLQFDTTGAPIAAGRMTVENKGFRVGALVEAKGDEKTGGQSDDNQWLIRTIASDGTVELTPISINGSESMHRTVGSDGADQFTPIIESHTIDEFTSQFKHARKRIALLKDYPGNAAFKSADTATIHTPPPICNRDTLCHTRSHFTRRACQRPAIL